VHPDAPATASRAGMAAKPRVNGVKRRAKLEALAYSFEFKRELVASAKLIVARARSMSTKFMH
jgi:hypothetical protein